MDTSSGMPTTAVLLLYLDAMATVYKGSYTAFNTFLVACENFRGVVSTIGHDALEQTTQLHRNNKVQAARVENVFKSSDFSLIQDLNNILTTSLPSGWSFGGLLPLNGWLTRINGNSGIATPANPIVLTGATTSGGALATTSAGNAPRVCFTHVGSNDMYESLPSAESTQVALTGGQNSYTVAITGVVPNGVTKINIYRGLPGAATGTWYYDQTVAVTAGVAYPTTITIVQPDSFLATTIVPPVWISALQTPELAYLQALSAATSSPVRGNDLAPYQLTTTGMLSPSVVALGPSNGWIGQANPITSAQFGTQDLTGAYVPGTIQTTNAPQNNVQGFVGAGNGIQVRASTMLNGTCHPTLSVSYVDSTHSTPQTQTGITPVSDFVGGILNEKILYTITSGRVVLSATITAHTGTATTGNMVVESQPIRVY